MKILVLMVCGLCPVMALAALKVDEEFFGESLGGWNSKGKDAAEYKISGTQYRTWKPHVTQMADGGLFVSLRIDHKRGIFASDDHASLELSFGNDGSIVSARSTIALQGRKITSDVIKGAADLGVNASTADRMVKVGTDLIADLTAKLLREQVSEPGRVGFPAAMQHNYHLLCLAVKDQKGLEPIPVGEAAPDSKLEAGTTEAPPAPASPAPDSAASKTPGAEPPAPTPPAAEQPVPAEPKERSVPPLEIDQQGKPRPKSQPLPLPRASGAP